MTTISSWNVNGLRSVFNKGFKDYLLSNEPDIICLQEIKSLPKDVAHIIDDINDTYVVYLNSANRPGYSGTAILVKKHIEIINYQNKMGVKEFDDEGRFQLLETKDFFLFNGYYPNGRDDHSRVSFKLDYSFKILDQAAKLKNIKPVIITGDLNTAHTEIDLSNPKSNKYTTGFLNIEREFFDQLISAGFIDTYRFFHPEKIDAYTWWSYRNNCREKNVGWRLDYFFINETAIKKVKKASIRSDILGSDHCPIHLEIDV